MTTSTGWQLARAAAEAYERVLVPHILGPAAAVLVDRVPLRPGQTVVDVGCGTGAATRLALARVGGMGRVFGIDLNPGMLDVARSRSSGTGGVEWYQANADTLPLDDGSADVVLFAQTLQFLPDRVAALREAARILKAGGVVGASVWSPIHESSYFEALVLAMTENIGAETAAGLASAFALSDAEHLRRSMDEAGFRNIEIEKRTIDLTLPPLEVFIPEHIRATPMAAGYSAAPADRQRAVVNGVLARLGRPRRAEGGTIPFTTLVALGTK